MTEDKKNLKEFVLYTIFGTIAFIISVSTYALLEIRLDINELIANAFAWLVSVLFAYIANKKWVFKAYTPTKTALLVQMFAFFGGRFITLVIEEVIILVFITILSYPSMTVKLVAQVIVVVLNYVFSKLFVFRNT